MAWPASSHDHGARSAAQLAVYVGLLVLMRRMHFGASPAGTILAVQPGRWVYYPIAALLGIALQIPSTALYEAILARFPAGALAEEFAGSFTALPLWRQVAAGIGIVVTTPLIEETFFRGAVFGTLRRQHGAVATGIVTTVLFALIHLQPQAFLPIGMVGASLALLRAASGSMWPGVVLHVAFNGVTFYAIASGAADQPDAATPWPVWFVMAGTVVSAGLLALVEHLRARDKEAAAASKEPS
jgi:membrane protease YdiL (CAAX protease family)